MLRFWTVFGCAKGTLHFCWPLSVNAQLRTQNVTCLVKKYVIWDTSIVFSTQMEGLGVLEVTSFASWYPVSFSPTDFLYLLHVLYWFNPRYTKEKWRECSTFGCSKILNWWERHDDNVNFIFVVLLFHPELDCDSFNADTATVRCMFRLRATRKKKPFMS